MKKLFSLKTICLLMTSMLLVGSLAACGDKSDDNSNANADTSAAETSDTGSNAAESSDTDNSSAEESTSESETEPETEDPNAVPDGYVQMELTNELYGLQCTFNVPEFDGWTVSSEPDPTSSRAYTSYYQKLDTGHLDLKITLVAAEAANLEKGKEKYDALTGSAYDGYIKNESIYERSWDICVYGDDILDGKAYAEIEVADEKNEMDEADYNEVLKSVQESVRIAVLDENRLYTADGLLLDTKGWLAFPTEATIGGQTAAIDFSVSDSTYNNVHSQFTVGNEEINIYESCYATAGQFEKYLESNEKYSPFECELAGYPAKSYIYNNLGVIVGKYVVQLDEENYIELRITSSDGELEISDIKAMLEGGNRAEIEETLTSYVNDFLSAAARQ